MTFQDGRSYEPAGSYETGWSVVPWMTVPPSPPPPSSSPPQPPAARASSAAPIKRKIRRVRPTSASFGFVQGTTSLDRQRIGRFGSRGASGFGGELDLGRWDGPSFATRDGLPGPVGIGVGDDL